MMYTTGGKIGMWFAGDVTDLLRGVATAQLSILTVLPITPETAAYRAGVEATLRSCCAVFGISGEHVIAEVKHRETNL